MEVLPQKCTLNASLHAAIKTPQNVAAVEIPTVTLYCKEGISCQGIIRVSPFLVKIKFAFIGYIFGKMPVHEIATRHNQCSLWD